MKHVVQRSNSRSSPSALRTVPTSWSTPVAGSNVSPSSRKRTAKAAEKARDREAAAGRTARDDPAEDLGLVAAAEQTEAALAEADRGVELAVEREHRGRRAPRSSGREALGRRGVPGERDEVGREVDADDVEAAPGQRERVTPRPAAHVEHPHPRLEPERVDEERRPPARCPW